MMATVGSHAGSTTALHSLTIYFVASILISFLPFLHSASKWLQGGGRYPGLDLDRLQVFLSFFRSIFFFTLFPRPRNSIAQSLKIPI